MFWFGREWADYGSTAMASVDFSGIRSTHPPTNTFSADRSRSQDSII